MLTLEVTKELTLESLNVSDANELFDCVDANRAYLKTWLPWLDHNLSVADSESFIRSTLDENNLGKSLVLAAKFEGAIVGTVGLTSIDQSEKKLSKGLAEIGYWLAERHQGKGIVTRSIKTLISHAEANLGIKSFQISAGTANAKSRRIAEGLGFKFIGEIKDAEWLYDHHVDHARYLLELR